MKSATSFAAAAPAAVAAFDVVARPILIFLVPLRFAFDFALGDGFASKLRGQASCRLGLPNGLASHPSVRWAANAGALFILADGGGDCSSSAAGGLDGRAGPQSASPSGPSVPQVAGALLSSRNCSSAARSAASAARSLSISCSWFRNCCLSCWTSAAACFCASSHFERCAFAADNCSCSPSTSTAAWCSTILGDRFCGDGLLFARCSCWKKALPASTPASEMDRLGCGDRASSDGEVA